MLAWRGAGMAFPCQQHTLRLAFRRPHPSVIKPDNEIRPIAVSVRHDRNPPTCFSRISASELSDRECQLLLAEQDQPLAIRSASAHQNTRNVRRKCTGARPCSSIGHCCREPKRNCHQQRRHIAFIHAMEIPKRTRSANSATLEERYPGEKPRSSCSVTVKPVRSIYRVSRHTLNHTAASGPPKPA